jgi:hypothetical protein
VKTTLNYATSTSARHSRRLLWADLLWADIVAGSIQVLVALFKTVFLSVFLGNGGSRVDEMFERPRSMVRRGFLRMARGREAARNYRR